MRLYRIMKAFPGLTPQQIDEVPAKTWDWLLAIDSEMAAAARSMIPKGDSP